MSEHPIEGLMTTAMNSIQDMVDVNTIIGEPIETSNNIVIIPISKVSFGFAAGGSEFQGETIDEYKKVEKEEQIQYRLPFGGGSGAGVSITPVAFLVIKQDEVKLMPIEHSSSLDKLLDYVPDLFEKTSDMMNKILNSKQEEADKIVKAIENKKQKVDAIKNRRVNNENIANKEKSDEKNEGFEFEYDETKKNDNISEDD